MMNTPLARAALTVSFSGPAISATRRAADLHQWSSHISQMMSAVFFGSQPAFFSTELEPSPLPLVRERRFKCNGSVPWPCTADATAMAPSRANMPIPTHGTLLNRMALTLRQTRDFRSDFRASDHTGCIDPGHGGQSQTTRTSL